ncbi:MAG TPA: hypothetical protein VMD25_02370 [Acidobacteriaceae bacterium]|nr:hypothetical protein [Acidobacteriaceae bacterium]
MASVLRLRWVGLAAFAVTAVIFIVFLRGRVAEAHQEHNGWLPISGNWTVHGNVVSNAHYGRGDMMLFRHPDGGDYSISAQVRFDLLFEDTHYGDAGLIIRTSDPQPGVDSYKGYYAGLRPDSQTVVLGRASYEWRLLREVKLAVPISSGEWYSLTLAAHGCTLEVTAAPTNQGPATELRYQDTACLTSGVAGLRSFYADASWRNVKISPF